MSWPRAALLSLSDKTGAVEFARVLVAHGTRIIASGGTAKHLREAGVEVTPLEDRTGFGELLGGRVKTLHPHVHAPILARRDVAADLATLETLGLEPIDLVAVTLYPFEQRAPSLGEREAVEEIDIGGVALLRAAAKNFSGVIVIDGPSRYAPVLAALEAGGPSIERRRAWAIETFARTARYDARIAAELARRARTDEPVDSEPLASGTKIGRSIASPTPARSIPPAIRDESIETPLLHVVALERARSLRYGENPHQPAALYARLGEGATLDAWREGRELSYNNLLDLEAAVALAGRFEGPACVIVKHGQPCGAARGERASIAYRAAFDSDPLSAFGGVVAFNRAVDGETAGLVAAQFVECVAAPSFDDEAARVLGAKKNLRAVRLEPRDLASADPWRVRPVGNWFLLQRDPSSEPPPWRVVTVRAPTAEESRSLEFAWEIAAASLSNAVAIARDTRLVGLGSGQTSRVDAVDVAIMKARRAGHDLEGTVLASDGFFPFADNIEHAAAAGVRAVVQPGGSMRDAEVIAACDRLGIAMTFTDRRVFRH